MSKFDNEMYNKGYEDGTADALNSYDYVKEFAYNEMECCTPENKKKIECILQNYNNGRITALEAVKSICDTYYNNL